MQHSGLLCPLGCIALHPAGCIECQVGPPALLNKTVASGVNCHRCKYSQLTDRPATAFTKPPTETLQIISEASKLSSVLGWCGREDPLLGDVSCRPIWRTRPATGLCCLGLLLCGSIIICPVRALTCSHAAAQEAACHYCRVYPTPRAGIFLPAGRNYSRTDRNTTLLIQTMMRDGNRGAHHTGRYCGQWILHKQTDK